MTDFLEVISRGIDSRPLGALYALLGLTAFIEGISLPIPTDLVVALGSFLAARRGANLTLTAACIVVGNVAGAKVVYGAVRRFRAECLRMRLKKAGIGNLEQRLELMHSKYGMTTLFVNRFVPGLRQVCPSITRATPLPPIRTAVVFMLASGI